MRLNRKFFNRNTVDVAKELLGKYLIRKVNGKIIKAKIIETEAYCGTRDLACHASKGSTPRTKVMFGPAGFTYIYLIYGMYHCLNIVTEKEGYPAAVLIRGVSGILYPVSGIKKSDSQIRDTIFNGPGKVCRELKIDRGLNNIDITKSKEIWIENLGDQIDPRQIKIGKRIGVDYAGKWKDKLWRFYL